MRAPLATEAMATDRAPELEPIAAMTCAKALGLAQVMAAMGSSPGALSVAIASVASGPRTTLAVPSHFA